MYFGITPKAGGVMPISINVGILCHYQLIQDLQNGSIMINE